MITKYLLLFFVLINSIHGYSQTQTFHVKPHDIDTNYTLNQDSNKIVVNTGGSNNKLFLFIGGTGSNTSQYSGLVNRAAYLGYVVINLSYPNSVAAASMKNSTDSLVFNKFRQEICFGTPLSNDVTVDTLNSIYTRFFKLLTYLDTTDISHNWGQYLVNTTTIDWSKIAIGGHSQGAGHAPYLAKNYLVDRVLMFSGPNDYSDHFNNSANWLRTPGTTSITKHYSYLSLNDEAVDYAKQFTNIIGLGMLQNDDSTYIDNISSPYNNSHCLYTTQTPGLVLINHNVPVKNNATNRAVWDYMLTDVTTVGVSEVTELNISVYPNPSSSIITVTSNKNINHFKLIDIKGTVLIEKNNININSTKIDISELTPGIYFIKNNSQIIRVIKN